MTTLRILSTLLAIGVTVQLFGQSVEQDTTIIFKKIIDGDAHSIFIDRSKDSKFYESITRFKFQYFDEDSYAHSTDYLKKQNITLTKVKPIIPWTNWVKIKQYKGQFYAYRPCDFLSHFRQSVNDSTFIDWTGEGPVANKIIGQQKIDHKTYAFQLTGIYDHDRKVIIHIIDAQKGIAVFEEITNGTYKRYYLMIAAEKIKSVPIIVNYCPTSKQAELQFDAPDFEALLSMK